MSAWTVAAGPSGATASPAESTASTPVTDGPARYPWTPAPMPSLMPCPSYLSLSPLASGPPTPCTPVRPHGPECSCAFGSFTNGDPNAHSTTGPDSAPRSNAPAGSTMGTPDAHTPPRPLTLADMLEQRTGGKRKRPMSHVAGIAMSAIVAPRRCEEADRRVVTPRRISGDWAGVTPMGAVATWVSTIPVSPTAAESGRPPSRAEGEMDVGEMDVDDGSGGDSDSDSDADDVEIVFCQKNVSVDRITL